MWLTFHSQLFKHIAKNLGEEHAQNKQEDHQKEDDVVFDAEEANDEDEHRSSVSTDEVVFFGEFCGVMTKILDGSYRF